MGLNYLYHLQYFQAKTVDKAEGSFHNRHFSHALTARFDHNLSFTYRAQK